MKSICNDWESLLRTVSCKVVVLLLFFQSISAQEVPYHIDNEKLYELIDELANAHFIDVNSVVKPYSRQQIAVFLQKAEVAESLSLRQKKEVQFYLKDFNKELYVGKDFDKRFDLFYYSDSLFKISINPIFGGQGFYNQQSFEYHRWNGAELFGSIGKCFGYYCNLRDNYESEVFGNKGFLNQRRGAIYKGDTQKNDYSEARGGITYSWKWGCVGLVKDHISWGNQYNGTNILSDKIPSFAHVSFKMRPVDWFEFNYVHGWLVSDVIDSTRSYPYYDGTRKIYANKYIAANMFSFRPLKKLWVSLGNSVVYDGDMNPAYLIPFLFYKSVDHTYSSGSNRAGQNAQLFFDVSSRQLKKFHLYLSLFIDEMSINRMWDEESHSNFMSIKGGARVSGLVPNVNVTLEYIRTNPLVYQHIIPTTTYQSNGYNMGHYLQDNSQELFCSVRFMPIRGLDIKATFAIAQKGKDYQTIIRNEDWENHPEINSDEPRWGVPYLNEVRWERSTLGLEVAYEVINDVYVVAAFQHNRITGEDREVYTPPFFLEEENLLTFGCNFGF